MRRLFIPALCFSAGSLFTWLALKHPRDAYHLVLYPSAGGTVAFDGGVFWSAGDARREAEQWLLANPQGDYEIGKNRKKPDREAVGVYEEILK
jgi:hypothetical protein